MTSGNLILKCLTGLGLLGLSVPLVSGLLGHVEPAGKGWDDSKVWVFDGHMHPTANVFRRGGSIGEEGSSDQFTLSLAETGGLGAAFFNTSIDEFYEANHIAVKELLRQVDHFYREIDTYSTRIGPAATAHEVRELRRQGKMAAVLAVEGAIAIESDLGVLRMLHRLGLREMNLVHNLPNNIGDYMYSTENGGKGNGLSDYGRELVREMNRLGILIDLSHTAEQTVMEVIEASRQPVVTTHSSVKALVDRPGNWSDGMIRRLSEKGGVICVPFLPQQVNAEFDRKWHRGRGARGSGIMGMDPLIYRGEPDRIYEFIREKGSGGEAGREEMSRRRRADIPPLSDLMDHVDYIVSLVGVDHVGISSDWGGYPANLRGIENAGQYQNVAEALFKRGYSRKDVEKIMGENLLRVFDEVVSTAGP